MKIRNHLILSLSFLLLAGAAVCAQPQLDQVGPLNAARLTPRDLPGGGIAPGSIFIVKGTNLGAAGVKQNTVWPVPTKLNNTLVQVLIGGTRYDCYMIYVVAGRGKDKDGNDLPDQIAAILPSTVPAGEGTLTVTYNGSKSDPVRIRIVQRSLGLFALNESGSGPATTTHGKTWVANTVVAGAHPGEEWVLWGTGLGAISTPDYDQAPYAPMNLGLKVFVGGKEATVNFHGRTPTLAGLDQINFVVPDGVSGCAVSVYTQIGTEVSNVLTMSVTPAGQAQCQDSLALTNQEMQRLAESQSLRVGLVRACRVDGKISTVSDGKTSTISMLLDFGSASFMQYHPAYAVRSRALVGLPSVGNCVVYSNAIADNTLSTFWFADDVVPADELDAGAKLTLTNSKSQTRTLDKTATPSEDELVDVVIPYTKVTGGQLSATGDLDVSGIDIDPLFHYPGQLALSGPGGSAVGAFNTSTTLSSTAFNWKDKDTVTTISRSSPYTVRWEGGNSANEFVMISGGSSLPASDTNGDDEDDEAGSAVMFMCTARLGDNQFQIPQVILSQLPATPSGSDSPTGTIVVGSIPYPEVGAFSAPGLDTAHFNYMSLIFRTVKFK